MICPICGWNNAKGILKCDSCDMVLLDHPLISDFDIENYKKYLSEIAQSYTDDFKIENDVLVDYFGKRKIVTIPAGVRYIGDRSFTHSGQDFKVEEVRIHSGVEYINSNSLSFSPNRANNGAFELCRTLRRICFEDNSQLREIGCFAFYFCTNLETIEGLPDHKVFIGAHAFQACRKELIEAVRKHDNYVFEADWDV